MSQQPKKVFFIITKATWGGAQRYVFDLTRSLPKESYRPIVAYGVPGLLAERLAKAQIEHVEIRSLQRDVSLWDDLRALISTWRQIRAIRPDIVHVNSSKAALLGALAARMCGVRRIVFTVHGWPFKERRPFPVRQIFYAASWLTALLAHAVIVVSIEDEKLAGSMPGVGEKVNYVPLGIEPTPYISKEEALQTLWRHMTQSQFPRETIKILTIAELTPNKGIRYAIEAMQDLQKRMPEHYVYVVISDGEQKAELEELVKSLKLEDRVFFLGFIPDAPRLLSAFDVFLLPSIKEGMPYVLLEAGDSGIPVIATDVINTDLSHRYKNMRIVPAGNALAISEAIQASTEHVVATPFTPHGIVHFPLNEMVQRTRQIYG